MLPTLEEDGCQEWHGWTLKFNHVHLLLRSSSYGLARFMRRLLTGYAVRYNRRHDRHGHLFQNRYKSIVCEEETYFKALVRYVHLNPLRAGVVASIKALAARQLGVTISAVSKTMSRSRMD